MRDGDVEDVVFLVVEEWESVEPDHSIGDTAVTESISNSFGYADNNLKKRLKLAIASNQPIHSALAYHGRQNIGQGTRQLEHNDRNGDGEVHNST